MKRGGMAALPNIRSRMLRKQRQHLGCIIPLAAMNEAFDECPLPGITPELKRCVVKNERFPFGGCLNCRRAKYSIRKFLGIVSLGE